MRYVKLMCQESYVQRDMVEMVFYSLQESYMPYCCLSFCIRRGTTKSYAILLPIRLGVLARALRLPLGGDLILVSDIRAAIPGGQTGSKTLDPAEVRGYPSAIT